MTAPLTGTAFQKGTLPNEMVEVMPSIDAVVASVPLGINLDDRLLGLQLGVIVGPLGNHSGRRGARRSSWGSA